MKFKLSLITLALATCSSGAFAFDFGVTSANTQTNTNTKWACKKCTSKNTVLGQAGIELGSMSSDDDHAANNLKYTDGFAAGVNADVVYNNKGYRTEVVADQLGSEQGYGAIKTGRLGVWNVEASFDEKRRYNADNAESIWVADGNTLIAQDEMVTQQLVKERKKSAIEAKLKLDNVASYIRFSNEDKTGKQTSSMTNGSIKAINIAAPIDMQTQNMAAGISLSGQNWLTELSYKGSWFENDIDSLQLNGMGYPVSSQAPDNQSQFVTLTGRYSLSRTHFSGRVTQGSMTQDADYVTLTGVTSGPGNADTQVDTLDANFKVTSTVMSGLRLRASIDYSDRDNKTDVRMYEQYTFDELSGDFQANTPLDTTRTAYKASASYSLAKGQRIEAGYDRIETERTNQDREETDDNIFWAQWRVTGLDMWDIRLKGLYSDRGGSEFVYDEMSESGENTLMRKYYLADKKSSRAELFVTHAPLDTLSLSFRGYYGLDDYTNTEIGLVESKDYGYDLGLSWQALQELSVNIDGGYQWIDSDQASAQTTNVDMWQADTEDQFGFAGIGFNYTGLSDKGINLSADYSYAISISDSYSNGYNVLGDYESTSHYVTVQATYAMTEQTIVGLKYQFERYRDSDDTQLPTYYYPGTGPTGLNTLGVLNHDYDAHLILATLQYRF
ncbi:MtrB/PioB family decaheme-associated outer membrane protein [Shewanella canadensis]|uniref:MtrB/PioB family decaheme-associated outer membrane protein n=1 Tax=Shewanella canadensis TaxID=271096 RepID=A0A431WU37_9GAMM|nr:MtrB/PioB family decaheme-associated outer membrane protein [Shewanella canadensis]RTR38669.1 MtrB/PioB family decaheme-associated outer membrane protein [Shewanella canadensis]